MLNGTGDIDGADQAAELAFATGESSDQPDARLIYGLQRSVIRFEQGRLGELEPELRAMRAQMPAIPGFAVVLAAANCQLDRDFEARRCLRPLIVGSCELPTDPLWLGFMTLAAQVAAELGDEAAARVLYEKLRPFPGVLAVLGGVATGCTAHYLGMLSATMGDHERAESHFIETVLAYERIGAPALLSRTKLEWARMLLRRGRIADVERSRALLKEALAIAKAHGLSRSERHATALLVHAR